MRRSLQILKNIGGELGFLEGYHVKDMFSMMRENDLLWSCVVSNYLLGGPRPHLTSSA
jgi:polyhydroxyalkanoate synthase